jgi:predicted MFS family arabinose efflux permease
MSVGYITLLRQRQFGSLFATQVTTVLATSISGLYLGTLVNAATGSAFLTSFAMFAPALANLLGAASLMSLADTSSPRGLMTALQVASALTIAAQALPIPLWMRFGLLILCGFLIAISSGLRLGLVVKTVASEHYTLARSLLNLTNGAVQICGFAFGGLFLQIIEPSPMFIALGVIMASGAVAIQWGIRSPDPDRVATPAGAFSGSKGVGTTHAVNKWAFGNPPIRSLLFALWVPNGIVVGVESLFIPYAHGNAGYLLAAGAIGMLCGDLFVGRCVNAQTRAKINAYQRLLMAAPYLLFCLELNWMFAALLVLLASLGFSASLGLQEQMVALTPTDRLGQIQGLESAGRLAAQAIFALAAGATADVLGAGYTMSMFGALSLLVTLVLISRNRTRLKISALVTDQER